jgi:hypothetical protein
MAKGIPRSSTKAGWPRPGSAGVPKPSRSDVTVPPMPTTRGAGREEFVPGRPMKPTRLDPKGNPQK